MNATLDRMPVTSGDRVAIVGGGMLGMTLALRMRESGAAVTLVEAADGFGGLASAWSIGDVTWDRHYHVILRSDRVLRGLLAELGLENEIVWSTPRTAFFTGGRLHSMSNAVEFLRFPPLGLIDKLRLGGTILYGSRIKDGVPLEDTPVDQWLTKLSGRKTFEKIWRPLLRAKLGDEYPTASAAFIWAIIARLYGARQAGVGREQFGYVPGGYARILGALEQRLRDMGVVLRSSAPVASVQRKDGELVLDLARGETVHADRAFVTLPAPQAAGICLDLNDDERGRLREKSYMGVVCVSLLMDEPLGPYYITNLTDEWVPFSAVIDMSAVVDRATWNGAALAYLPKYAAPDDPLFDRSDDDIVATFTSALERVYPNFRASSVKAARVSKVRRVFPIATLGYSRRVPPIATSVPGLFVANSAHIVNGTLNVDETLQLAQRVLATAAQVHSA
jgi:protoporphyrinogen oxidase